MADASTSSKEEQARKAHALAEKCFLAGNVYGARQWMQSAVRLAPGLPGTAQAVAAYDVHHAAARRPPDWYAVLGLQQPRGGGPLAHDDIKRQHRRLCLLVHPDKNPCAAADGAFKLVQAAWHALSARHPPAPAPAAAKQPAPTPPQPPPPPPRPPQPRAPEPKPRPRPRPQVVQMPRRAPAPAPPPPSRAGAHTAPSYAQQASRPKPKPPAPPRSVSPTRDKCPACGAYTPNGKRSFRCGSCHWSPIDNRPDDDEDFFEEDYY